MKFGGSRRRLAALAILLATTPAALLACDRKGGGGNSDAFCAAVTDHQAELFGPLPEATPDAAYDLVDVWKLVGADAPLAIEADWQALILNLETAIEGDEQAALARAYATEPSAVAVTSWLAANCGLALPVATIVPQAVPTSTPTATPPAAP